jgi:NhaA family Na+:H+ antiporter
VGVVALLGRRVPPALRLLLVTIAIVDDLGAVLVIAVGYTAAIDSGALAAAAGTVAAMVALNRRGVRALPPYLLLGVLLWLLVYRSGVHATVAGVLTSLAVPLRDRGGTANTGGASPLERLEHALAPWVALLVVPLFGFANAGVALAGIGIATAAAPLPLGIAAGLFLGKQAGVFAAVRIAVAAGVARRPAGAGWAQLWGMSLLCGIGFTMSLFIGGLAFADPARHDAVRVAVLAGSLLSALAGYAVLRLSGRTTA